MSANKYDVLRELWKSVAVLIVMEVSAWNASEVDKLEVGQNREAGMTLNASRYAAVKVLRGGKEWNVK